MEVRNRSFIPAPRNNMSFGCDSCNKILQKLYNKGFNLNKKRFNVNEKIFNQSEINIYNGITIQNWLDIRIARQVNEKNSNHKETAKLFLDFLTNDYSLFIEKMENDLNMR